MNRINLNLIWIILLIASSCAISRKENERIEKLLGQQAAQADTPMADSLTQEVLIKYEDRAIQKLEDFYDYLTLLGNASYGKSMKEEIVISALGLFFDSAIEINSFGALSSQKFSLISVLEIQQSSPVPDFTISHFEISESLKLKSTSNYAGQISYLLVLGKEEDRVDYKKHANFCLRKIDKKIGNKSIEIWEVFLEDIN